MQLVVMGTHQGIAAAKLSSSIRKTIIVAFTGEITAANGVMMSFLLEVLEFTLAGFYVGMGFWLAFVAVAWSCGLRKLMK